MYYANYMSLYNYYTVDCSCVGKLFSPFLAKSRAHTHTLYGNVCTWVQDFARNGKIIFQCNFVKNAESHAG